LTNITSPIYLDDHEGNATLESAKVRLSVAAVLFGFPFYVCHEPNTLYKDMDHYLAHYRSELEAGVYDAEVDREQEITLAAEDFYETAMLVKTMDEAIAAIAPWYRPVVDKTE